MSRKTDLAWAAGFFDGEGCVSGARSRKYQQIYVAVSQKNPLALIRFQKIVGTGYIKKLIQAEQWGLKRRTICFWKTANYEEVKRIFTLLKPYLCQPKIDQFQKRLSRVKRARGY